MMSPATYFSVVVEPTVAAFYQQNDDLRLAALAAMATLHIIDHAMHNRIADAKQAERETSRFSQTHASQSNSFKVVKLFALASKHCVVTSAGAGGFSADNVTNRSPAIWGNAKWGNTLWGDGVGGITVSIDGKTHHNLTTCLQVAVDELLLEFPELRSV